MRCTVCARSPKEAMEQRQAAEEDENENPVLPDDRERDRCEEQWHTDKKTEDHRSISPWIGSCARSLRIASRVLLIALAVFSFTV